jgi:predicted tellurium resistance membrane protein TerC
MEFLSGEYIARIFGVLGIDLILSDDTVVMAMGARSLQGWERRQVIIRGATGTVVLRHRKGSVDPGAVQEGYVRTVTCPIF